MKQLFGGMSSYSKLLVTLLTAEEIDVDILLMMKDEVGLLPTSYAYLSFKTFLQIFDYVDCSFYSFVVIRRVLEQEKIRLREASAVGGDHDMDISDQKQSTSALVQNTFDMLRVLESPPCQEEIDDEDTEFLGARDEAEEREGERDDSNSEEDSDDDDEVASGSTGGKSLKRKSTKTHKAKKKKSKLSLSAQAFIAECHSREFSKAWLLLLSCPMSQKTVKLILKHLPDNVVPYLQNPLLLADYLSTTVKRKGIVAVLALESLFHMIVKYNLDYPNYFSVLYDLCSPDVFAARYRTKFMHLLHNSLKSTNIPAYVAGAFIKKLVRLCLEIPGPAVMFCLTQVKTTRAMMS